MPMIIKSIIVIMLDLIIMILIGDVCVCMCLCGLICSQKYEYLEGYDSKCGIFFRTITQWSRTWGVGYFGVKFFFAFFLLVWTLFIYMGWKKMFRVHKITDYVV